MQSSRYRLSARYSCWRLQILTFEVVLTRSWAHRIRRLNSNKTPTLLLQPTPRLVFFIKITHNVTGDCKHHRTLELLRELGLVRENHLPGEQPHYEAAEGKAHHHLVCRNCRAIIHLDNTLLGNLNEQLQEQYHFYSLTLDLVASGYCDSCWKSIQREPSEKQA